MIPIKVPWTKQPPAGTPLDRGNSLVKYLVDAYMPLPGNRVQNLITGNYCVRNGTATTIPTEHGWAIGPTTSGNYFRDTAANLVNKYSETEGDSNSLATVVCGANITTFGNWSGLFSYLQLSTDTDFSFIKEGDNDFRVGASNQSNAWINIDAGEGIVPSEEQGEYKVWGICSHLWNSTSSNDGVFDIYTKGRLRAQNVTENTTEFSSSQTNLGLMVGRDVQNTNGYMTFLYTFNKRLTLAEHTQIARNPWQLFQPRTIWIPQTIVAGGGGVSIPVVMHQYARLRQ